MPLPFLEMMCAFQDEATFSKAFDVLKVEDDWWIPASEGIQNKFVSQLPDTETKNPITHAASETFLSAVDHLL